MVSCPVCKHVYVIWLNAKEVLEGITGRKYEFDHGWGL